MISSSESSSNRQRQRCSHKSIYDTVNLIHGLLKSIYLLFVSILSSNTSENNNNNNSSNNNNTNNKNDKLTSK